MYFNTHTTPLHHEIRHFSYEGPLPLVSVQLLLNFYQQKCTQLVKTFIITNFGHLVTGLR